MRKPYSDLTLHRRNKFNKIVETGVRDVWNQVAPRQSDTELMKCLQTFLPPSEGSQSTVERSIRIAYIFAEKKGSEDLKTQILSTFVLHKDMKKQKLESLLGCYISDRKYSHAKFHAVNCGPGQALVRKKSLRCVEDGEKIIDSFVGFCMDNGIITANGRSVALPGIEVYSVPNIKRVEGKYSLIRAFEEKEKYRME